VYTPGKEKCTLQVGRSVTSKKIVDVFVDIVVVAEKQKGSKS